MFWKWRCWCVRTIVGLREKHLQVWLWAVCVTKADQVIIFMHFALSLWKPALFSPLLPLLLHTQVKTVIYNSVTQNISPSSSKHPPTQRTARLRSLKTKTKPQILSHYSCLKFEPQKIIKRFVFAYIKYCFSSLVQTKIHRSLGLPA